MRKQIQRWLHLLARLFARYLGLMPTWSNRIRDEVAAQKAWAALEESDFDSEACDDRVDPGEACWEHMSGRIGILWNSMGICNVGVPRSPLWGF